MEIVPIPLKQYGKFFTGDAYIVLQVWVGVCFIVKLGYLCLFGFCFRQENLEADSHLISISGSAPNPVKMNKVG